MRRLLILAACMASTAGISDCNGPTEPIGPTYEQGVADGRAQCPAAPACDVTVNDDDVRASVDVTVNDDAVLAAALAELCEDTSNLIMDNPDSFFRGSSHDPENHQQKFLNLWWNMAKCEGRRPRL